MKNRVIFLLLLLLSLPLAGIAQFTSAPAFPGAEGHGRYVTGGRGGTVIHVTNLNDSGTGSFRQAVKGDSKKIVVFDVAGVIALKSDITFGKNTTILGQTAPSPGITLRYYTVRPSTNNVIRFIRFRRGQERDVNDGADASWQRQCTGIIFDHCSFSWSIDEVGSFYDNNNFTLQWCTLGEALNNAGHGKGAHGYGGIWGGKLASFHHNLLIHLNNRVPRFNGARYNWSGYTINQLYSTYKWTNALQAENVDFRNCVMFNWGTGCCYGGPGGGQINMVNNYYKGGPATKNPLIVTQASEANEGNGGSDQTFWGISSRYFIEGNYVTAAGDAAAGYDWKGVEYDNSSYQLDGDVYTPDPNNYYGSQVQHTEVNGTSCVRMRMDEPIDAGSITTHEATVAYDKVLDYAGASLYPDDVDVRYARETRSGTPEYTGSVTELQGIIDVVADVEGYTEANFGTGSQPSGYDTDGDGIPDEWEEANGLDPNKSNATTYTLDALHKYYTDVEVYANALVETIVRAERADAIETFDEYYPEVPSMVSSIASVRSSKASAQHYNLLGQKVSASAEGVHIVDGRLVLRRR